MPRIDAYLVFDGTCAEAMRFYERTLGGTLETLMTDADPPIGAGPADRILYARLVIDGRALMASDAPVGQPYAGMHGFSLSIEYADVGEARRVFDALAEGGKVTMPMERVFWAEAFGMLVDRFGTRWMVNGAGP